MQQLQRSYVVSIREAKDHLGLHEIVQKAIELEHATIPPYLTAMFSLAPQKNEEIRQLIFSIVKEEMLHMSIACNVLNALGGAPQINSPNFIPPYPGPLPMHIAEGLSVSLQKYSEHAVRGTFMKIEEPEDPIDLRGEQVDTESHTIGEFYEALKQKILALPGDTLPGDPCRQVASFFPSSELFPIITQNDAARAIDIIVVQGEGSTTSPLAGDDGEYAHYYRFEELAEGRRLKADPTATNGYSFTGAVIPFEPDDVFNIVADTKAAMLPEGSAERRNANQFNFAYGKLLNGLHRSFNGEPEFLANTIGLMFDVKLIGQKLCATEFPGRPGDYIGPTFEYTDVNL